MPEVPDIAAMKIFPKKLIVYSDGSMVGELSEDQGGVLSFSYSATWIENQNAVELSPDMPVSADLFTGGVVELFFENLLPEGEVLNFISASLHISKGNVFGLLERFGGDTAGKFSILPENILPTQNHRYLPVTVEGILELFDKTMGVPFNIRGEESRMSISGAQDKMTVFIDGNKSMFIPLGDSPSSHIIKPSIVGRHNINNTAINESFVMDIAKKIGFNVAGSYYSPELSAIIVTRYDREFDNEGRLRRVHQVDLCQALGVPSKRKYESEGGPSLKQCFDAVMKNSAQPILDKKCMIEWVVFNFLVGNMDGHAKNLSLLTSNPVGPLQHDTSTKTKLAPFYDMVSTAIYPSLSQKFAFKIGGENRPRWIGPRHWVRFAEEINVNEKNVFEIINDIVSKVNAVLPSSMQELKAVCNQSELKTLGDINDFIMASSKQLRMIVKEYLKIEAVENNQNDDPGLSM